MDVSKIILSDLYAINKEDWKSDVSIWPSLTKEVIENFSTSCPGHNFKSLLAFNYDVSGKLYLNILL